MISCYHLTIFLTYTYSYVHRSLSHRFSIFFFLIILHPPSSPLSSSSAASDVYKRQGSRCTKDDDDDDDDESAGAGVETFKTPSPHGRWRTDQDMFRGTVVTDAVVVVVVGIESS
eukprot:TRINITY_DN61402_c0_g1_i1.p1 TRINITY_DN61402_c0_g1~~TRINITY_DN61402_c0_g1_i1.p1  ORF type:complete len:115 (+),score=14.33 TRINITY_DN61402_c0_g1_i1:34-378(+)